MHLISITTPLPSQRSFPCFSARCHPIREFFSACEMRSQIPRTMADTSACSCGEFVPVTRHLKGRVRMTRLSAAISASVVLVFSLLASPLTAPPVAAQVGSSCGRCYDNADADAHTFGYAPSFQYWNMDCNAFNSCHSNSQYGSCSGNHLGCGLGSLMLLDAVSKLAERGEGKAVEDLATRYPAFVVLDNHSRAFVTDCDGRPMTTRPISIA